jgi:four helix bundle protein
MQDFHQLDVWTLSHSLTLNVYRATATFPGDERFGLTSQLRRSCASIPANIAEGCGRDSSADFARFLQIALGSASETEYHLLLARDLRYLDDGPYRELELQVQRVKRMLSGLRRKVLESSTQSSRGGQKSNRRHKTDN